MTTPQKQLEQGAQETERAGATLETAGVEDGAWHFLRWCATPLLRRFPNPFFSLAATRHARRSEGDSWWFFTAALLVLIGIASFLYGITASPLTDVRPSCDVVFLVFTCIHLLLCIYVAARTSSTIFQNELQSGTLEGVLLLPLAPSEWLAKKLAFPLYFLLWAWLPLTVFPLLMVACGLLSSLIFTGAFLFPLLGGLGVLSITLLSAPDVQNTMPLSIGESIGSNATQPKSPARAVLDMAVIWIVIFYCLAALGGFFLWLITSPEIEQHVDLFGVRRFYDFFAPATLFWIVLNLGLFSSAVTRALAALSLSGEVRAHTTGVCWSALGSIYYTALGFFWPYLDAPYTWTLFLTFPCAAMASSWMAQRREPGLRREAIFWGAEREILWLSRQFNNAVFIKDLRSFLRATSLRRGIVRNAIVLGLGWQIYQIMSLYLAPFPVFKSLFGQICLQMGVFIFNMPNNLAAQMWQKEARGMTLPMMLISPLSSREILQGRLCAALIAAWGRQLPLIIVATWLVYNFSRGPLANLWIAILTIVPLGLAGSLCGTMAVPDPNLALDPTNAKKSKHRDDFGCAVILGIVLLSLVTVFTILLAPIPLYLWWFYPLLFGVVNTSVPVWIYRRRIDSLDKRRAPAL